MPRRAPTRRIAAALGVVLLLAGVVLAAVLFVLGPRYRDRQVDQFARGVVGCTTPLVFTETGTFYVYAEVAGPGHAAADGCPADPQPGEFRVELRRDGEAVELTEDHSTGYDVDGAIGTSIGRIEVAETGTYQMTVTGPDAATLAAVGPDPGDVVSTYRRWALIGGVGGVLAGLALLIVSGLTGGRAGEHSPGGDAPVRRADPWAPPSPDDRRG